MSKIFTSFYGKLSLLLLACFLVIGVVLTVLANFLTQNYQSEVEQKLHLKLAEHIVHDNQLFHGDQINHDAIKHAFHGMMILGPSFEFYVVSPTGDILTYSADPDRIKRRAVSVEPINDFMKGIKPLPIVGDDPRSTVKRKIFSVAPSYEQGDLKGYLYIIIGGEIYDDIADLLQQSHILSLGGWSVLLILLMTLVVALLLFAKLTRPLRRLTSDMEALREHGFESAQLPLTLWRDNSADEIERLGNSFNELTSALHNQYQKVKNTDELRRELISYVSHDLRTPLASLQGYLETWLLKHKHENPDVNLIDVAMKNAQHMSSLIEQLFELAYLEGDNVALNVEPISIAELAHDVMQKRLPEAQAENINLDVNPKDTGIVLLADYQKLERVLSNLLDNAIRHTEPGGHVEIRLIQQNEKAWRVEVADTGLGIPENEMKDIFTGHFRASNSVKGKGENSGLGLAICKRSIELHNSQLEVSSHLGKGTVFSFSLEHA